MIGRRPERVSAAEARDALPADIRQVLVDHLCVGFLPPEATSLLLLECHLCQSFVTVGAAGTQDALDKASDHGPIIRGRC